MSPLLASAPAVQHWVFVSQWCMEEQVPQKVSVRGVWRHRDIVRLELW